MTVAEVVSALSVVVFAVIIGVLLLYRLREHYEADRTPGATFVRCPECHETTYAFERTCRHCGYNRWEGGGNE